MAFYSDYRKQWAVFLLAFVLGGLALFTVQKVQIWSCENQFDLLNRNALCRNAASDRSELQYDVLRNTLIAKIDALKKKGEVTHISVYFRDLKNGPRFGIQEYQDFHTASLLKLPVMIAILHMAVHDPAFLDKQLVSPASLPPMSNVDLPEQTIQPNTAYAVRDLLRHMILYSDNDSANMLVDAINAHPMPVNSNTFLDLGVLDMMAGKMDDLSMQSYANLFTALYNASYLPSDLSEFALKLLSESTYKDALVAGVPADVRVAHKFGYFIVSDTESELHDCGIVYHPTAVYDLCVLTSGSNIKSEAAAIAEISKTVYEGVNAVE